MKLSELIEKLQEIHESVPFDSEVVTQGSDWYNVSLVNVVHEAPETVLIFDDNEN